MPLFFAIFGMLVMILAPAKRASCLRILRSHLFCLAGQVQVCNLVSVGTGSRRRRRDGLVSRARFLHHLVLGTDQAGTVTGRSDVWAAGWQLIKQRMLLGRGFMSSGFLAYKISVSWQPGHLHNGFLEVLYNNGLVGLFVM